ncbi:MAG: transposase [Nitrososphaerales archaeon]|nr:transposase [Nitrososphaerales archaeon]
MQFYKAVKQPFEPDPSLLGKMEAFRDMVNDCLRIGLGSDASKFSELKPLCYQRMWQYDIVSSYRTSAIFEAARVLQKHRTDAKRGHTTRPYCKKPFLTASIGVWVDKDELVLPDKRTIRLNPHTLSVLSQVGVMTNSVVITTHHLAVCYRKNVRDVEMGGAVALDVNLENVTTADSEGRTEAFDLSPLVRLRDRYRRVSSRFRRHDHRVRGAFLRKYGALENDAREALLHRVSSAIVRRALERRQAIIMEDLRGIREIYRKSSGSSAGYLSKMNAWPFAKLARQVAYKAKWEGLPVVTVEPQGTSNECSECGGAMTESAELHPYVKCESCGLEIHRDVNSARVILKLGTKKLGLRFGQVGPASEAMEGTGDGKDGSDAKVDAGQSLGDPEVTESKHC